MPDKTENRWGYNPSMSPSLQNPPGIKDSRKPHWTPDIKHAIKRFKRSAYVSCRTSNIETDCIREMPLGNNTSMR